MMNLHSTIVLILALNAVLIHVSLADELGLAALARRDDPGTLMQLTAGVAANEVAAALKEQVPDILGHEADPDSIKLWQGHVLDLHLLIAKDHHRFLSGMPGLLDSTADWVALRDMLPVSEGGIMPHADWDGLEKKLVRPLRDGAVLPDFTLEGPLDLYITPPCQLHMWLPHSVEVGTLKRVMLRDGAAVTVRGARSTSLRRAVDLPSVSLSDFVMFATEDQDRKSAAGLMHLATGLREEAARKWNGTGNATGQNGSPIKATPALVALEINFGAAGREEGALMAAPDASGVLQRLRIRRVGEGVVELTPRESLTKENSKAIATAPTTPYAWPLRDAAPSTVDAYEKLLRDVLARQVFNAGSGSPRAAPDLPLRLLHSTAKATVLMAFDLEVSRPVEPSAEGQGAHPPSPKELLTRMAKYSGRRSGKELWRAVVRVEGSVAEGTLKFQPIMMQQVEIYQDTVTFSPEALMKIAARNQSHIAGQLHRVEL